MELRIWRKDDGFCPVYQTGKGNKAISARELWKALGVKTKFATWFERESESHGFNDGRDFVMISQKRETMTKAGKKVSVAKEYILRLEAAKHIAMATMTEQGKKVRDYFLWCEEVKEATQAALQSAEIVKVVEECSVPQNQKRFNKAAASRAYRGEDGMGRDTNAIIEQNVEVCKSVAGKRPSEYRADFVRKGFRVKSKSAREIMRTFEPEKAGTCAVYDKYIAEGVSVEAMDGERLNTILPPVFRALSNIRALAESNRKRIGR